MIRIRIQDPGLPCILLQLIKCHGLGLRISCLCVKCNVCLCWWVVVYVLNALSYFQIPSYLSVLWVNWQGLEKVESYTEKSFHYFLMCGCTMYGSPRPAGFSFDQLHPHAALLLLVSILMLDVVTQNMLRTHEVNYLIRSFRRKKNTICDCVRSKQMP